VISLIFQGVPNKCGVMAVGAGRARAHRSALYTCHECRVYSTVYPTIHYDRE